MSKLATRPSRSTPCMLHFDIVLDEAAQLLLVAGLEDHRSVPVPLRWGFAHCPPQLAISSSLHVSGAELIRQERRLAPLSSMRDLFYQIATYAGGEQKHGRIGFDLQILSCVMMNVIVAAHTQHLQKYRFQLEVIAF